MQIINLIKNFHNDESGAVTVDWVVLTAAIVGLGLAVVASVSGGVNSLGESISAAVSTTTVGVPSAPATPTVPAL